MALLISEMNFCWSGARSVPLQQKFIPLLSNPYKLRYCRELTLPDNGQTIGSPCTLVAIAPTIALRHLVVWRLNAP
jgi:hypothetical protein